MRSNEEDAARCLIEEVGATKAAINAAEKEEEDHLLEGERMTHFRQDVYGMARSIMRENAAGRRGKYPLRRPPSSA